MTSAVLVATVAASEAVEVEVILVVMDVSAALQFGGVFGVRSVIQRNCIDRRESSQKSCRCEGESARSSWIQGTAGLHDTVLKIFNQKKDPPILQLVAP